MRTLFMHPLPQGLFIQTLMVPTGFEPKGVAVEMDTPRLYGTAPMGSNFTHMDVKTLTQGDVIPDGFALLGHYTLWGQAYFVFGEVGA